MMTVRKDLTKFLCNNEIRSHDLPTLRKALRDAYDADHAATVIVIARSILKRSPDDVLTWIRLGHSLSETAQYDEAETALRKSLDLCEKSVAFVVFGELGLLFKLKGQYQVSADWFRKAIDARPDEADAYIFLGSVLARDGKLLEAEAAHRSATQCDDGCIDEAYLNLGLVLRALGRYGEARQCFERALELDPEYQAAQDGIDDIVSVLTYVQDRNG